MTDVLCDCDYCVHITPDGKCSLKCIDIDGAGECMSYEEEEKRQ